MLLWPLQNQTSPNRTSLSVIWQSPLDAVMLYGPPASIGSRYTFHMGRPEVPECKYMYTHIRKQNRNIKLVTSRGVTWHHVHVRRKGWYLNKFSNHQSEACDITHVHDHELYSNTSIPAYMYVCIQLHYLARPWWCSCHLGRRQQSPGHHQQTRSPR